MKRYARALVQRASKRARTAVVAYAKKKGRTMLRNVGRRIKSRASKSKAARAFGNLVGKLGMDNSVRVQGTGTIFSNAQNVTELTNIPVGATTTTREGNRIFLKGIAINIAFTNTSSAKKYLNYALLTPRSVGGSIIPTNFFRANEGSTNTSFNDLTLTALTKHTRPINVENHIVHFHKRWKLGCSQASGNYDNATVNTKHYKFYVRINSMVAYSDKGVPTGVTADNRIFAVIWFNDIASSLPLSGANLLVVEQDYRVIYDGE